MGVIADIRDAINTHVDRVSGRHRLRFARTLADNTEVFACMCEFAGDRRSYNDHIAEMYRIAAFDAPLTPSVKMSEQAAIEKHRGRTTRAAR